MAKPTSPSNTWRATTHRCQIGATGAEPEGTRSRLRDGVLHQGLPSPVPVLQSRLLAHVCISITRLCLEAVQQPLLLSSVCICLMKERSLQGAFRLLAVLLPQCLRPTTPSTILCLRSGDGGVIMHQSFVWQAAAYANSVPSHTTRQCHMCLSQMVSLSGLTARCLKGPCRFCQWLASHLHGGRLL